MVSLKSIKNGILLVVVLILTSYLSLFPLALFITYCRIKFDPFKLIGFLDLAFFIFGAMFMFFLGFLTVPPILFRIFRLRPKEGIYEPSFREDNFVKWLLGGILYQLSYNISKVLSFAMITYVVKVFGGKIGKNSWIIGEVTEPYLFIMGENSYIGGHATINNHLYENGKLILGKVVIGNNCLVGERAIIFPGVILKDNTTVGALSLVPKNKVLDGGVWVGIPVRKIRD